MEKTINYTLNLPTTIPQSEWNGFIREYQSLVKDGVFKKSKIGFDSKTNTININPAKKSRQNDGLEFRVEQGFSSFNDIKATEKYYQKIIELVIVLIKNHCPNAYISTDSDTGFSNSEDQSSEDQSKDRNQSGSGDKKSAKIGFDTGRKSGYSLVPSLEIESSNNNDSASNNSVSKLREIIDSSVIEYKQYNNVSFSEVYKKYEDLPDFIINTDNYEIQVNPEILVLVLKAINSSKDHSPEYIPEELFRDIMVMQEFAYEYMPRQMKKTKKKTKNIVKDIT